MTESTESRTRPSKKDYYLKIAEAVAQRATCLICHRLIVNAGISYVITPHCTVWP